MQLNYTRFADIWQNRLFFTSMLELEAQFIVLNWIVAISELNDYSRFIDFDVTIKCHSRIVNHLFTKLYCDGFSIVWIYIVFSVLDRVALWQPFNCFCFRVFLCAYAFCYCILQMYSMSIIIVMIIIIGIVSSFFEWRYMLTCISWRFAIVFTPIFGIIISGFVACGSWGWWMCMLAIRIVIIMSTWRTFIYRFFICWIRFFHGGSSTIQYR